MLRQISPCLHKGDYRESAQLRLVPEDIPAASTIKWISYEDEGLGPARGAPFAASTGDSFSIEQHLHLRDQGKPSVAIQTLFQSLRESDTLDEALCELGLTTADLAWVRDDIRFSPHELLRQDDNGNQDVVGVYPCRADALAAQIAFESRGHKQVYWTRKSEKSRSMANG